MARGRRRGRRGEDAQQRPLARVVARRLAQVPDARDAVGGARGEERRGQRDAPRHDAAAGGVRADAQPPHAVRRAHVAELDGAVANSREEVRQAGRRRDGPRGRAPRAADVEEGPRAEDAERAVAHGVAPHLAYDGFARRKRKRKKDAGPRPS